MRRDLRLIAEADLRVGQRHALGDQDLTANDVEAGDHLGDGVLDLDARVDLDEVELAGVGIDRNSTVPALSSPTARPTARAASRMRWRSSSSRFGAGASLDDLLVPPLDRAVALEQVDEVAVPVAEELHLDVPCALDELFEEHVRHAERRAGLAAGLVERRARVVGATAPAACRGRRRPSPP